MINCDVFLIFAQNIGFGYTIEPPQSIFSVKRKSKCTLVHPSFTLIKVGCEAGVLNYTDVIS